MVNVLVVAILIIPWLIIPFSNIPDPTRLVKAAFFDLTMLGIIVMAIKNGLKFEYKNKYLSFLIGWVFITFLFNWYYPILRGFGYNVGTLDSMIHITLASIATVLVCSNFDKVDFIRCAKALCISSTLVSIFCIFQAIGLDPMKHIVKYSWKYPVHVAALLDNPDLAGNYLCMSLPLFLYLGKPKYYLCLAISVIGIIFTQSSLSMVAAFVGIFVYLLFRFSGSRKMVIGLILAQAFFIAFCVITPSFNKVGNGFTGRIGAWGMILNRLNNPLFGQGLGAVKSLNVATGEKGFGDEWIFAHNDYLETYAGLGALGLFLLILVIIHAFKNFNYKMDNQVGFAYYGCFVSFLIVMFGSFPMEFPPLALNGLVFYWAISKT